MKKIFLFAVIMASLASCEKAIDSLTSDSPSGAFIKYTILKGAQGANPDPYRQVETSEMKFIVRFDSSAIYTSSSPANQYDINKLYGFSDNGSDHHQFSARFGWRWNDGAIRLFAYVYNAGVRESKELGMVAIGSENACSITVSGNNYIFTLNDQAVTMPRASTTTKGNGYKLYPYFGGDETAPHEINIWIKQVR